MPTERLLDDDELVAWARRSQAQTDAVLVEWDAEVEFSRRTGPCHPEASGHCGCQRCMTYRSPLYDSLGAAVWTVNDPECPAACAGVPA